MVLYTNEANGANTWKLYLAISSVYSRVSLFLFEKMNLVHPIPFLNHTVSISLYTSAPAD